MEDQQNRNRPRAGASGGTTRAATDRHATTAAKKNGASRLASRRIITGADGMLAGILDEVETHAVAEEQKLQARLAQRQDDLKAREREVAEERKRRAQAQLAEEQQRQRQAEERRAQQILSLEGLDAGAEEADAEGALGSGDYASATQPRHLEVSRSALAAGRKSRVTAILAMAAGFALAVAAAALFLALSSGPDLDPNSYPKVLVDYSETSMPVANVGVAMIPAPEPVRTLPEELATPTDTESAPERSRTRTRTRDRQRDQDQGQGATNTAQVSEPIEIDLDGANIFNRGSE